MNYRVNLLPPDLSPEAKAVNYSRLVKIALISIAVFGLGLLYGGFLFSYQTVKQELAAVQEQIDALEPVMENFQEREREITAAREAAMVMEYQLGHRNDWAGVLIDIDELLPVDMWLTAIHITWVEEEKPEKKEKEGVDRVSGGQLAANLQKMQKIKKLLAPKGVVENDSDARKENNKSPLPGYPNVLLLEGKSRSAPSVGVFINHLGRLPYFQEVNLEDMSYGDQEGILTFQIKTKLREVHAGAATP